MRALALLLSILVLAGCGKDTPPPPPSAPPKAAPMRVDVYPIRLEKAAVFDEAIRFAEEHTKTSFRAAESIQPVWDKIQVGGRVNSGALVQLLVSQAKKLKPEDRVACVLGVCERDIGSGGADPVFLASSREDRAGVISWYRLSNEALGLPSDDAQLGRRAGKQLIILASRLIGLPKCTATSCVVADAKDLPALDALTGDPCPSCRKAWEAALAR